MERFTGTHGTAASTDIQTIIIDDRCGLGAASLCTGFPFLYGIFILVQRASRLDFIASNGGTSVIVVRRNIETVVFVIVDDCGIAPIPLRQLYLLSNMTT